MKTVVICAAIDCKYHNDNNVCLAKRILLNFSSVMTVWNGRQEFLKCRTFEKSSEAQDIEDAIRKYLEEREDHSYDPEDTH